MRGKHPTSRNPEGGYALLMVFLMAAIIALMLYQQLPRVAFETEREKEQLLIDRGEQYIRAIQLYYIANNRQFPTSIEDLEKREKRFLRRRYIDPYTGKDEWRIIHGNGVYLTDSLVQKPPGTTDSSTQSASNTTTPANGEPQVNAAVLQRPSDRPNTPTASFNQPNFGTSAQDALGQVVATSFGGGQPGNSALPPITLQPGQAGQPGGLPPITLAPAGGGNQPGGLPPITLGTPGTQPGTQGGAGFRVGGGVAPQFPGQVPGQVPGQIPGQIPGQTPGQTPGQIPGQVPGQVPGQFPFPGQTGPGGLPGGIQTGVPPGFRIDPNGQLVPITAGQPQQGTPGQPVGQQPGGAQDPNSALNLINQLLTNPRQTPTVQSTPTSGNQIGAIAGIASTHKGPSIKVYKDQDHYELWEFVFSPTAATAGAGGAPGGAPGRGGTNQPGGQPNTFGGQPGGLGGQQGGFGGPGGGGQGGPGQPGGLFQTAPIGR